METMCLEVEELITNLDELVKQHRKTSLEIEQSKAAIIRQTLNTIEYCKAKGISRMTLYRRRDKGLISFVMIEGEYRYFNTPKGGQNG
jgi:transcriptional regulator of acetoin/glycerol metabolism